jgi:hypothetical protein
VFRNSSRIRPDPSAAERRGLHWIRTGKNRTEDPRSGVPEGTRDASKPERQHISLKLDTGKSKTFRANTAGCEALNPTPSNCIDYHLVGFYLSAKAYLIYEQGEEGGYYKLVSAHTGEERMVDGVPRLATDGDTFLVTACDSSCRIGIGSMASSNRLERVWPQSDAAGDEDPEWKFVRWIDNDQVALRIEKESNRCPRGDCEAILKRTGGSWTLEEMPPRSDVK